MLNERKILVTGSSSGIGQAITSQLLKAEVNVIGIARNHEKFQPKTSKYSTYNLDVSDIKSLSKKFSQILDIHPDITGIIHSVGYGLFGGLESFSPKQIMEFINTNLTSSMIMTRLVLPILKNHNSGDIIFIGSEAAIDGSKKGSLYSAAKFGLRGFSQAIRKESSHRNIRVCLINPGMVRTPFFNELNFSPGDDDSNAIHPNDVAELVQSILSSREGTVFDEINLSPLKKVIKST